MQNTNKIPVEIKDSGQRTEFQTGAVRDMSEGKGRCDLMPLDIIAEIVSTTHGELRSKHPKTLEQNTGSILKAIHSFKCTKDRKYLYFAIHDFIFQEQTKCEFNCGQRSPYGFILRLAQHYEQGAKKYGENNWQKGIPIHSCIDSAVRHLLKYRAGYIDEPHDVAFVWNLVTALYMLEHKPEMDDYCLPVQEKGGEESEEDTYMN